MSTVLDLTSPKVLSPAIIPGLAYHQDFLSQQEHDALLNGIEGRRWKPLQHRRLQNYGGLPHAKGMLAVDLPAFLDPLVDLLVQRGIFDEESKPNHALVNRYEPGEGIEAHEDGPVFLPFAAIVSLQAPIVMDFYDKGLPNASKQPAVANLVLHPRSLLCIAGSAYRDFFHGIASREEDIVSKTYLNGFGVEGASFERAQRTSITLRRSCKTLRVRL